MAKHPKRPASRASFRPIGFLGASTPSAWSDWVAAFLQRLRDGSSFDHLVGHHFASAESQLRDVEEAARGLALKIRILHERVNPIAHQTADFRRTREIRRSPIAACAPLAIPRWVASGGTQGMRAASALTTGGSGGCLWLSARVAQY